MPAAGNAEGCYTIRLKAKAGAPWEEHHTKSGRHFSARVRDFAEAEALLLLEQGRAWRVQVRNDNNLVVWDKNGRYRAWKIIPEGEPEERTVRQETRCSECLNMIRAGEAHYRGWGKSDRTKTSARGKWHKRCWAKARERCSGA